MDKVKILDIDNDGLNMATDGQCLYVRCMRVMYKYILTDMRLAAENVVFKKDGKARAFSINENYVFLTDFCDLYILHKNDLYISETVRLGADASSDLGVVRFDDRRAYISIRNGKMAVMDISTGTVSNAEICGSSSWDFCVTGNRIYSGTVNGELIETDIRDMHFIRCISLCKKNIYSVVCHNGMIYTVSQDTTIKIVDINNLETVCEAKKAVKGMTKILGFHNDSLVIADGGISLWDKRTLELQNRFDFPTGHFNKGVLLHGGLLIGSDYHSIYRCAL